MKSMNKKRREIDSVGVESEDNGPNRFEGLRGFLAGKSGPITGGKESKIPEASPPVVDSVKSLKEFY